MTETQRHGKGKPAGAKQTRIGTNDLVLAFFGLAAYCHAWSQARRSPNVEPAKNCGLFTGSHRGSRSFGRSAFRNVIGPSQPHHLFISCSTNSYSQSIVLYFQPCVLFPSCSPPAGVFVLVAQALLPELAQFWCSSKPFRISTSTPPASIKFK